MDEQGLARIEVDASRFLGRIPEERGADQPLVLYYDETNNFGKLKLDENGLNVSKSDNFVLGGIALTPGQEVGNIDEFRKLLRVQKNADEVKFEMVAHGAFDKMLGSMKLGYALDWLLERNVRIHYTNLNILNWAILDIIESIVANKEFADYIPMHRELKNELYHVATRNLPVFLSLLNKYGYPCIERERTSEFLGELYLYMVANWPEVQFLPTRVLKEIILQARTLPELCFLVDNDPGRLIEGLESFFLNRICTFKNSSHFFDEEKSIREAIGKYKITHNGEEIVFQFVNSKEKFETQLSDIVAGFFGRYFTFIERTPAKALVNIKRNLNSGQKRNVAAIGRLISNSDSLSGALLKRITTMDSENKSDYFLFDRQLSTHLISTNR
ncbi:DUF3800 domain-containing protein [Pseudomonas aeruginosa]|uniref:DUF3800 domain-containing protein n=1 Tax=Pseudomonas aeruginosa TaxID=287 RepID=UPI001F407E09|nr:DUF3800 domain-containing protein [Pseudomonas aeruginosa]